MEMDPDGVKKFRELPGPLHIVAFTGGGRTGKSTLASAALGRESLFPADNTKEPVTFGIHAAAIVHPSTHGSLVLLDCEGTDNAFGPARRAELVGTLALLTSNAVVSVCWQGIEDSHIERLAKLVAGSQLVDDSSKVAPPLLVVVNAARFPCSAQDLENLLSNADEPARGSNRIAVRDYFGERSLITVPDKRFESITSSVEKLVRFVLKSDGQQIVGEVFVRLLEGFVEKLNAGRLIEPVGQYEFTILQWLRDLSDKTFSDYEAKLGHPSDDYQPNVENFRCDLDGFESRAGPCMKKGITYDTYEKVKADLEQRLKYAFQERVSHNNKIGSEEASKAIDTAKCDYRKKLDGLVQEHHADEQQHSPSRFLLDAGLKDGQLAKIAPELYEAQWNAALKEMQVHFANWQKDNSVKDAPKVKTIVEELLAVYKETLPSTYTRDVDKHAPTADPAGDRLRFAHLSQVLIQQGTETIKAQRLTAFNSWKSHNETRGQEVEAVLAHLGTKEVVLGQEKYNKRLRSKGDKAAEGVGWGAVLGGTCGAIVGGPAGAAAGVLLGGGGLGGVTRFNSSDDYEEGVRDRKQRLQHLKIRKRNGEIAEIWKPM